MATHSRTLETCSRRIATYSCCRTIGSNTAYGNCLLARGRTAYGDGLTAFTAVGRGTGPDGNIVDAVGVASNSNGVIPSSTGRIAIVTLHL